MVKLLQFLEIVFTRDLISSAFSYRIIEIIRNFVSNPDGSVRLSANRVIQKMAPGAKIDVILRFLFEGRKKVVKSGRTKFTGDLTMIRRSRENNRRQNENKACSFSPSFIASTRIQNKGARVTHIVTSSDPACIVIQNRNLAVWMGLPTPEDPVLRAVRSQVLPGPVIDCAGGPDFFLFALENGQINRLDYRTGQVLHLHEKPPLDVKTVTRIDNSVYMLGCGDGQVRFLDVRQQNEAVSDGVSYDCGKIISAAKWPKSDQLVTVGFDAGIVSTIDMRMMMPFHSSKTVKPVQLVPTDVKSSSGLSFVVCSKREIEFVCGRQVARITGCDLHLMPYSSDVLVLDAFSCNFVRDRCLYQLGDRFYGKSELVSGLVRCPLSLMCGYGFESLHQHTVRVTAAAQMWEYVVSGDESGFVNLWRVGV
jgi:hypothetical protein